MLGLHQATDFLVDRLKLFRRGLAVFGRCADAGPNLTLQARDADHIELVQVRCGDRQETHTLQQRVVRIVGFFQNAGIECQPGNFTVDIAFAQLLGARTALRPAGGFLRSGGRGARGLIPCLRGAIQLHVVHPAILSLSPDEVTGGDCYRTMTLFKGG